MQIIRKAVFPVAGLGTRFLPATKAMPKELLPIIDKPVIQFAVEEAVDAGITDLVFVTGRTKRAIEDHFDGNPELESVLASRGKDVLLEEIRSIIPSGVNCIFVRQAEALGLGHAILCAEPVVGHEPFAVLLPDDLMAGSPLPTKALVQHFEETGKSSISVTPVEHNMLDQYGVISPISNLHTGTVQISGIVEKPEPDKAPSNLAAIGRYVFHSEIFDKLRVQTAGVGGEIQLTDSINALAKAGKVDALEFSGHRYDCGSKFGFLEAIVDHALEHPEFGQDFASLLQARANLLSKTRNIA
ncbi:UTP--glucose-1-phosphate uridylyltransferase GalU [uncultured Shimia sp.]|uniref:UTP--glucose-1-phosphate uridylyltransferase GalU n=1 Tax=uncultured Shimia sp. TaxID=573152 RepID=UPI00260A0032|nr:UTP--glucose-1-phosphate uridylyltransferase GalU [uncultured Shimia sp.]